mmetsp:Transcript_5976/g.14456  ORF Transcript_5976/g.14456 Transcript_5976/m.14456 type:complete len:418 (-) Transcript_5976:792-2045(-)
MSSFGLPAAEWATAINFDVYVEIAAYFEPADVRALSATATMFRAHNASAVIWEERIARSWGRPGLQWSRNAVYHTPLPMAVLFATAVQAPHLLEMTATGLELVNSASPCQKVLFVGEVARRNRVVRSVVPFPTPNGGPRSTLRDKISLGLRSQLLCRTVPFLRGGAGAVKSGALGAVKGPPPHPSIAALQGLPRWPIATRRPFTMPLLERGGSIVAAPTHVAYFEVHIESRHVAVAHVMECVAIGLSQASFPLEGSMPGWDSCSYGYHSDDGGVFHASGHSVEIREPFGVGDVVGCGMDYGGPDGVDIFFTKNGRFLGTCFSNVQGVEALYPTIGLDAAFTLKVNFGDEPFMYDVGSIAIAKANAAADAADAAAADVAARRQAKKDSKFVSAEMRPTAMKLHTRSQAPKEVGRVGLG